MADWMAKANAQKDDYLRDLTTLVKIPSVRDDSQATPDAPLGPGPTQALHTFLAMAAKDGKKKRTSITLLDMLNGVKVMRPLLFWPTST